MNTTPTTHTPGPWEIRPSTKPGNGTKWRDIVSTGTDFAPSYVGEALEQDARLIAAAPELLAALKQIEDEINRSGSPSIDGWDKARQAIAKAEGRT